MVTDPTQQNTTSNPAAPTNGAQASDGAAITAPAEPKFVSLPSDAVGAIRREAKEKEQKAILGRLGVSSIEEAEARMKAAQAAGNGANTANKAPAKDAAADNAAQAAKGADEVTALRAELAKVNAERVSDQQKLRQYAQLTEKLRHAGKLAKARADLAVAAVRAGAVDEDYAVAVAERHIAGLDDAAAGKFNPGEFFAGLKTARPAIFQAPVSTANVAGNASAEQAAAAAAASVDARPGEPTGAQVAGGTNTAAPAKVPQAPPPGGAQTTTSAAPADARALSPEKYQEEMRAMGLSPDVIA